MRRVDDTIQRIVSEALLTKVRDPRIGSVSVTRVQTSPEFDTAKVWVYVPGGETERASALEGLRSAAPFLQSQLARAVRLRRTPRLRFFLDEELEQSFRIEETLRALAREREEAQGGAIEADGSPSGRAVPSGEGGEEDDASDR
jgi:ribosome-binding factor A